MRAVPSMAKAESNIPPSAATVRVSPKAVRRAVNALLKWKKTQSEKRTIQNPQLLQDPEDSDFIYLLLTLKKIPPKDRTNPYKIPLPNPLFQSVSSDFCLIIDDRPKSKKPNSKLTVEAALKRIKAGNLPISKVLKLSKLKSDYRSFEAKAKLCDSYEMFFTDKRVFHLLPKLLGKQFYRKKKKIPLPVDLTHCNWKEEIERACSSALLCLSTGTCSVVRVGKCSMDAGDIVENVIAAISGVVEVVPKKWARVTSFHLKFSESLALPIYQALPDWTTKIEGVKEGEMNSGLKKRKVEETEFKDADVSEDKDGIGSEESKDDEMGGFESWGKKRLKGNLEQKLSLGELNREERLKEMKKGDDGKEKKEAWLRKMEKAVVEREVKGKGK